jgi:beta-N-acetylhexosaminidase
MKPVPDGLLPLTDAQERWVEKTLGDMSIDQRIGQTLMPTVGGEYALFEDLHRWVEEFALGGVFVFGAAAESHRKHIDLFQRRAKVPLVIAADLECGAGYIVHGAVQYPDPLACGAADDEELAYAMGRASALQGRSLGIHWTYAPVVDVIVNPDNPITANRAFGDDPERIVRMATAVMRGMQDHGLAACAKHFPGDGVDDLDQHVVTTINSLSMEQWKRISGRTFSALYNAGCMSTMIGHIALPAWEPERDRRGAYRPASVSRRIVTDLLRKELGFEGLIVTDDMNMGGVTGYMNRRDRTVGCLNAGCDMVLFARLPRDVQYIRDAVKSGELSEERVTEAARRVLEFKARLNIPQDALGPEPTREQVVEIETASRTMAEKAAHLVRDLDNRLPLKLQKGSKVLTITLSFDDLDLPEVDEELKRRGFEVDHLRNPNDMFLTEKLDGYDAVFLNYYFKASWAISSIRCVGPFNRIFLGNLIVDNPKVVYSSFGSPFHLRQFATLPNLLNLHSPCPDSQRAAVKAWFGELDISANKSPVRRLQRDPVSC